MTPTQLKEANRIQAEIEEMKNFKNYLERHFEQMAGLMKVSIEFPNGSIDTGYREMNIAGIKIGSGRTHKVKFLNLCDLIIQDLQDQLTTI